MRALTNRTAMSRVSFLLRPLYDGATMSGLSPCLPPTASFRDAFGEAPGDYRAIGCAVTRARVWRASRVTPPANPGRARIWNALVRIVGGWIAGDRLATSKRVGLYTRQTHEAVSIDCVHVLFRSDFIASAGWYSLKKARDGGCFIEVWCTAVDKTRHTRFQRNVDEYASGGRLMSDNKYRF